MVVSESKAGTERERERRAVCEGREWRKRECVCKDVCVWEGWGAERYFTKNVCGGGGAEELPGPSGDGGKCLCGGRLE